MVSSLLRVGLALCAALAPALGCGAPDQDADVHAFQNVTIVDLRSGQLHEEQTIVWERSRIIAAGPRANIRLPDGAHVVDAHGAFAIPGFWDMHVHLVPSVEQKSVQEAAEVLTLPLFIANGVTGVRDMADIVDSDGDYRASSLPLKRRWDAEARAGLRIGPRLVVAASFEIDGPATLEEAKSAPPFFGAATPQEARKLVRFLVDERQADFLKVYSGIPRESYFALMDEARRMHVVVAGHKPVAVSFIEAADAGQKSMEHAREILLDSFPGAESLRSATQRNQPPRVLRMVLDQHDPRMLEEIFTAMRRNDAYYVPTHLTRRFDWKAAANDPQFNDDPRLQLVDPQVLARWRADALRTRERASNPGDADIYRDFFRKGLVVTRQAYEAGVKIMAGTDAGDSWCFPGSGLHEELALMERAGLSPLAILRAATVVPAEYVGRTNDFGAIAPGKVADLVLLDANPLAGIENTRAIRSVVFNGRLFDRAALDDMQVKAAEAARNLRNVPER